MENFFGQNCVQKLDPNGAYLLVLMVNGAEGKGNSINPLRRLWYVALSWEEGKTRPCKAGIALTYIYALLGNSTILSSLMF